MKKAVSLKGIEDASDHDSDKSHSIDNKVFERLDPDLLELSAPQPDVVPGVDKSSPTSDEEPDGLTRIKRCPGELVLLYQ